MTKARKLRSEKKFSIESVYEIILKLIYNLKEITVLEDSDENVDTDATICLWSGDVVPYKWSLCDGTNGTPLLPIKSISTKKQNYIPTLGGNTVSVKYIMYTG